MADKNSVSQPGAISGETEDNTVDYVTKDELNAMINGFRKSFKKDLDELKNVFASQNKPDEPAAPRLPKSEADAAIIELRNQLKVMQDREKAREAVLAEQSLHNTLREQLTQHGVNPQFVDHAIAYLNQKKLVRADEDGTYKMKVNQVDYDLNDAVKAWAKTDEAKLYLSPKGTQGSGQTGPVRSQGVNRPASPDRNVKDLDALTQAIMGKVISGDSDQ